ncbi:MAG: hypothetical protein HZB91_10095 [Elusimicrobia bacterium]|nr:hypothetical protein [Elusimicrobiota bacterium]
MPARAMASVFAGLAAGASCPAAFHLLLRQGTSPSTAASAVTALAALAHLPGGPAAGSRGLLGGAAGVLIAGLVSLPLIGAKSTLTTAVAAAGASLILRLWLAARGRSAPLQTPAETTGRTVPIIYFGPALLLASAASSGWVRLESLLTGNWSYGQALTLAALLAGAGPGWWAGRKAVEAGGGAAAGLEESLGDQEGPPVRWGGLALAGAGLWGVLVLHFMGFVGLNAGDGEFLQTPMRHAGDALFLMGQPCLALASWSFLVAAALSALASDGPPTGGLILAGLAAAGPFAGVGLGSAAGPEAAFLAPNAFLMILGLAVAGPSALRKTPVLSKIAAAGLGLGLWLSWTGGVLMRDIWTNRLDAVFPGGNFLMLSDDGDESLGSYQFPSGVKLLLADGVAVFHDPKTSRRFALIPLLARSRPEASTALRALFLGVRDPLSLAAALDHGAEVLAVDPHPGYADLLKSLADGPWPPAEGKLSIARSGLRRHLEQPGPGYDLIFLQPPVPMDSAKSALLLTTEGLAALSSRLAPDGILAVPLVSPVRPAWLARTLAVFGESFPHAVLIELDGRRLLLASLRPLPRPPELVRRLPPLLALDEAELAAFREEGESWSSDKPRSCPLPEDGLPKGAPLETDDLPRNAFPLAEILARGPSVAR